MSTLAFDFSAFQAQFPGQFLTATEPEVQVYWDTAICYVSPSTAGSLTAACRRQVLNLLTAHLMTLAALTTAGQQPGFKTSATVDKVTVAVQPHPPTSQYQWFYNQTAYGQQAYAMLYAGGAGGTFFGGFNEIGSFRRAGGVFTPEGLTADTSVAPEAIQCALVTLPPLAPYDHDLGSITVPGDNDVSFNVPEGCIGITAFFFPAASGDAVISVWSGNSADSGNRYNVFFWNEADFVASNPPTAQATNQDITGALRADGFQMPSEAVTSSADNVILVSGFSGADSQVVNLGVDLS